MSRKIPPRFTTHMAPSQRDDALNAMSRDLYTLYGGFEAAPPLQVTQDTGGVRYSIAQTQLAWIKVTSASPLTITLPSGTTITGYAALIDSSSNTSGAWSDGATVWFVGVNNEVPATGERYQCRLLGADSSGVAIWATEETPLAWVKVISTNQQYISLASGANPQAYPAIVQIWNNQTGLWNDDVTVWFIPANNETPTANTRYPGRLLNVDVNSVAIWGAASFGGGATGSDLAWVKVVSTSTITIYLDNGTIVGYRGAAGTFDDVTGIWSDVANVYFIGVNGEIPVIGTRYQARLLGDDSVGTPIWGASFVNTTGFIKGIVLENNSSGGGAGAIIVDAACNTLIEDINNVVGFRNLGRPLNPHVDQLVVVAATPLQWGVVDTTIQYFGGDKCFVNKVFLSNPSTAGNFTLDPPWPPNGNDATFLQNGNLVQVVLNPLLLLTYGMTLTEGGLGLLTASNTFQYSVYAEPSYATLSTGALQLYTGGGENSSGGSGGTGITINSAGASAGSGISVPVIALVVNPLPGFPLARELATLDNVGLNWYNGGTHLGFNQNPGNQGFTFQWIGPFNRPTATWELDGNALPPFSYRSVGITIAQGVTNAANPLSTAAPFQPSSIYFTADTMYVTPFIGLGAYAPTVASMQFQAFDPATGQLMNVNVVQGMITQAPVLFAGAPANKPVGPLIVDGGSFW